MIYILSFFFENSCLLQNEILLQVFLCITKSFNYCCMIYTQRPCISFQTALQTSGVLPIVSGCVTDATTVECVMTRRGIASVPRDSRDQTASEVRLKSISVCCFRFCVSLTNVLVLCRNGLSFRPIQI